MMWMISKGFSFFHCPLEHGKMVKTTLIFTLLIIKVLVVFFPL